MFVTDKLDSIIYVGKMVDQKDKVLYNMLFGWRLENKHNNTSENIF